MNAGRIIGLLSQAHDRDHGSNQVDSSWLTRPADCVRRPRRIWESIAADDTAAADCVIGEVFERSSPFFTVVGT
jgi:hypothetical protein